MIQVFSSGGGTQSACIAALIVQGRLPKPDFAAIVDTGRERSTTWKYHDEVIAPALASVGVEIVRIGPEWASVPAHGKNWMSHNGNTMLLPAFSNQSGSNSKLPGYCSNTWKVETFDRWLSKTRGVKRIEYRKWIGFSLDEATRAARMMNGQEYKAGLIHFPLIQAVTLRRRDSIAEVEKMGWPTPPRSACWMCPNQGDHEWRDLKLNHPDEFEAACKLEDEVREVDSFAWFHKSCIPLREVDFTEEEGLFSRACDSGVCFV